MHHPSVLFPDASNDVTTEPEVRWVHEIEIERRSGSDTVTQHDQSFWKSGDYNEYSQLKSDLCNLKAQTN